MRKKNKTLYQVIQTMKLFGSLWASSGAAPNQQRRAELKLRLTALRLTVEGVAPSDPLGREVAYGPTGAVYQVS
jgi:hypothetical protein